MCVGVSWLCFEMLLNFFLEWYRHHLSLHVQTHSFPTRRSSDLLTIAARDGTEVPVSIVYPRGFPRDGSRPLFLYAYGAYGMAIPPGFSTGQIGRAHV